MNTACDTTATSSHKPNDDFPIELANMCRAAAKGPYSKQDILDMCEGTFLDDPVHFYRKDFVSFAGKTTDTEELYSEVISAFLLENIDTFKDQMRRSCVTLEGKRCTDVSEGTGHSNGKDEAAAKHLFSKSLEGAINNWLGEFIGLVSPPGSSSEGSFAGANLIAYSDKEGLLWIATIEHEESESDALLGAVLEAYARFVSFDGKRMLEEFGLPESTAVKVAALFHRHSRQWVELMQDRPMQRRLMESLVVEPFSIWRPSDFSENLRRALFKHTGTNPDYVISYLNTFCPHTLASL